MVFPRGGSFICRLNVNLINLVDCKHNDHSLSSGEISKHNGLLFNACFVSLHL